MKKFKKDKLARKGQKLMLKRETIKDLTLRTQVADGKFGPTASCISPCC